MQPSEKIRTLAHELYGQAKNGHEFKSALGAAAADLLSSGSLSETQPKVALDELVRSAPESLAGDDKEVRLLCLGSAILAVAALDGRLTEGRYEATAAALHLSIDVLADYALADAICQLIAERAEAENADDELILAIGDRGISLARAEEYSEAISHLQSAVERALSLVGDFQAAARYSGELGRCLLFLDKPEEACTAFENAYDYARKTDDGELLENARRNLSTAREALR